MQNQFWHRTFVTMKDQADPWMKTQPWMTFETRYGVLLLAFGDAWINLRKTADRYGKGQLFIQPEEFEARDTFLRAAGALADAIMDYEIKGIEPSYIFDIGPVPKSAIEYASGPDSNLVEMMLIMNRLAWIMKGCPDYVSGDTLYFQFPTEQAANNMSTWISRLKKLM